VSQESDWMRGSNRALTSTSRREIRKGPANYLGIPMLVEAKGLR